MSTPAVLLELVGQAVLPSLGEPSGCVPPERLARDVWSAWARDRDAAGRADDALGLLAAPAAELPGLVAQVVRRLLPGRAGAAHAALTRYLAVLPALLRRAGAPPRQADDLLRWLPPRLPRFQAGDRPAGLGDRELVAPAGFTAQAECWVARNPRLPSLPAVLLAFYADRGAAERTLAWHEEVLAGGPPPGLLAVGHSFLDAEPPCLQLGPTLLGGEGLLVDLLAAPSGHHGPLFAALVEAVSHLHRRRPAVTLGRLDPADVLLRQDGGAWRPLLVVLQPEPADARQDVLALGRIGQALLGPEDPAAPLLAECGSADPLHRPADAQALLGRLAPLLPAPEVVAPPPAEEPETRSRSRGRRGAEVWKILDSLQKAGPELAKLFTNTVGMKLALVPAGTFAMGAPADEAGRRDNEGPVHEVVLSKSFYLGLFPVTQGQYEAVMRTNPSRFAGAGGGGLDYPVESVSWDDAVAFCARLSALPGEQQAGRAYRLPTEAEWEYACRAGTTTPFAFGPSLAGTQACFDALHPYGEVPRGPAAARTARVGTFAANRFGLYDMHGNVWEWCADWFDAAYYQHAPRQDPPGPAEGAYRVLRGGSWRNHAVTCRAAYRNALAPNQRQPFIGFRVAMTVPTS
jgi:formylglycine-generating enzyme required for sulfatase activity